MHPGSASPWQRHLPHQGGAWFDAPIVVYVHPLFVQHEVRMSLKQFVIAAVCMIFLMACGMEQAAPTNADRITHYHGTPLPTPDDPVAWQAYPAAWLVVGDQITAGMYLTDGRAQGGADWSLLPLVTLPEGVEPVVVVGDAAIRSAGVWTFDLAAANATWQPVAATRTGHEPATYTLAPLTATVPQVLQIGVDYAEIKGVSYGWQVQVETVD